MRMTRMTRMTTMTTMRMTMSNVTIHIAVGVQPFQLEDFPKDAKRSVKGALYLRGNATKTITEDELEALKKARPDLVAHKLRVLPIPKAVAPEPEPQEPVEDEQESESEAEDAQESEPAADEQPAPDKGKGKGKSRGGKKRRR